MSKLYEVELNSAGAPDFSTAKEVPQLEICPIYGGMCGYPSNLCYECPRHEGAKEQPQWWTEGLQPSAQPETHEERTKTHACDCVSGVAAIVAAIEAVDEWDGGYNVQRANMIRDAIKALPSAQPDDEEANYWHEKANSYEQTLVRLSQSIAEQPEIIRCKDCKWWAKQKDSLQGRCELMKMYPTGGWFCANARKERR